MIPRRQYQKRVRDALRRSVITAILGPRQCGKTTLAKNIARSRKCTYFDLESQPDLRRLQNPELALGSLSGLVVIDEIQTMPVLFPVLRVLADRARCRARFLILGSASPGLIRKASETLAGRVEFVDLQGFSLEEVGDERTEQLWLRGGFPRSFLARSEADSAAWREGFIRTFLERDLPQLGITLAAAAMRRFWTMLAHVHGQTWNASEIGRSMGLTDKTVRSYLDLLTQTYMVRQLQPWFENINKRQVKAPKVYFQDSGLLHSLLVLPDRVSISAHPRVGASWEGFALDQVLRIIQPPEAFFWSVHSGAELDLFCMREGKRLGVEFKYAEAPAVTRSMRIAMDTLKLSHLWVVSRCSRSYQADAGITVCNLKHMRTAWRKDMKQ